MIKRDVSQLAVYQLAEEEETLALECLRNLYLKYASEIIYITKGNKLYGMICLGDVLHHTQNGRVTINKKFTALVGYNIIRAHEIFRTGYHINKIPVVNEENELIGDYSRWDDMLFLKRNQAYPMAEDAVKSVLKPYENVYIVEPVEKNKRMQHLHLLEQMRQWNVEYTVLVMEQIEDKLSEKSFFLFIDEDERRAALCLYNRKMSERGAKIASYRHLMGWIKTELQFRQMGIGKSSDISYDMINDKEAVLFSAFRKKGITCLSIYPDKSELTEYAKKFKKEVEERLRAEPLVNAEPWPKRLGRDEFYGELLENEDYVNDTAQREIYQAGPVLELRKDITGKYFNAKNGRRITCFQPEKYIGTIYMLGPCAILGVFVEDQYTIPSLLQRILLAKGYHYRVENLGAVMRPDAEMDTRLLEVDSYCENDIIIAVSRKRDGISKGISLEEIFEKNNISSEWVTDEYLHCSHKANRMIADSMLELIEPYLVNGVEAADGNNEVKVDLHDTMKAYIQHKYLDLYFSDFCGQRYCTVGAIVMNCNPFSKGHRYLIEQAKKQVEFLIVFVVEENSSIFPFEERFLMVKEGTKDLNNILVVPSGEFVLSNNNFHEYFDKRNDDLTVLNAEYDVSIFANYIARPLHITHRFAGEEPEDIVTGIYNHAMKKILPQEGIIFVEIPRITMGSEVISASRVRKYLEEREYDKAFALLPKTTQEHFIGQIL